jgi:hypothetical protein
MIMKTLAAEALSLAGGVGTIALLQVFLEIRTFFLHDPGIHVGGDLL